MTIDFAMNRPECCWATSNEEWIELNHAIDGELHVTWKLHFFSGFTPTARLSAS